MTNVNRQPPLTRSLATLNRQELIDIIVDALQALYLDYEAGRGCFWNPEMEWDVTTIDEVAAVFRNHGLIFPADVPERQE